MAIQPQFALINSEFNDFLFASIGEEKNGIQLTLLSALTRLGLDPWGEAARLSALPREAAARALAAAIALLPEGDWKASDSQAIAVRLTNRLPNRNASGVKSVTLPRGQRKIDARMATLLLCVVLAAGILFAVSRLRPDTAPEPAPNPASSVRDSG
jgi:hypothetical protein